jgi:hypothetical protein
MVVFAHFQHRTGGRHTARRHHSPPRMWKCRALQTSLIPRLRSRKNPLLAQTSQAQPEEEIANKQNVGEGSILGDTFSRSISERSKGEMDTQLDVSHARVPVPIHPVCRFCYIRLRLQLQSLILCRLCARVPLVLYPAGGTFLPSLFVLPRLLRLSAPMLLGASLVPLCNPRRVGLHGGGSVTLLCMARRGVEEASRTWPFADIPNGLHESWVLKAHAFQWYGTGSDLQGIRSFALRSSLVGRSKLGWKVR